MIADEGTIAGRYRLDNKLGSGGMGEVWLAHDRQLDRPVAMKFLALDRPRYDGGGQNRPTEERTERFLREARAAARINSAHVVTVHDQGIDDSRWYLVMEYIDGHSLVDYVGGDQVPTLEQTVRWGGQVCEGLADAHAVEVVHRDVKPSNIMINERGDAKLVDFGLARLLDDTTTQGTGLTWRYASPERVRGKAGDHRSDLYSVGCVLYEMLTGNPPFGDDNTAPMAIGTMHLEDTPVAPLDLRPGIPEELNALTLRLLEKDPRRRPYDAAIVASRIRQVEAVPDTPGDTQAHTGKPHVNPDYVTRIRELERYVRHRRRRHDLTSPDVVRARMELAELTGASGDPRGAVVLYQKLGNDCRDELGPYDERVLDAFEGMSRWVAAFG